MLNRTKPMVLGILFLVLSTGILAQKPELPGNGELKTDTWERVDLKQLPIWRLAVPFGWLVSETPQVSQGESAPLLFVSDRRHAWRFQQPREWEKLVLKNGVLFRIKVPSGWLVRQSLAETKPNGMRLVFVPDPRYGWQPKSQ